MSGRKHCSLSWENAWPWHSGWDAKDVSITSNSCGKLTCGLYISLTRLPNFASWGYLTPHLPKGVLIIGLAPCQAYCIWSDVRTYMYVSIYVFMHIHTYMYMSVWTSKHIHDDKNTQQHVACHMFHADQIPLPGELHWRGDQGHQEIRAPRQTPQLSMARPKHMLLSQIFVSPRHVGHLKGWVL